MTTLISTQRLMQEDSGFSVSTHNMKHDVSDPELRGWSPPTQTLPQILKHGDSDFNTDLEASLTHN